MKRASLAAAWLVLYGLCGCGSSGATGGPAEGGTAGQQAMPATAWMPPGATPAAAAPIGTAAPGVSAAPSAPVASPAGDMPLVPPSAVGDALGDGMSPTSSPTLPTGNTPGVGVQGGASGGVGGGMASAPTGDGSTPSTTPVGPVTNAGRDPVIPDVTEECPSWRSGTISFMGLGGIAVQAGSKGAEPGAPMVFYWHGTGSFAGEYATMASAVHRGVMAEGGILVSFQGSTGGDLLSGTAVFGKGDLDLADQLAACAVRDHNVDPHRIFATGCSAGGLFSTNMAALRSNYIAAAAPNSGGMSFPQPFQNDYTPALMTVHGAPGLDVVIIDFSDSSKTADGIFAGRGGFVVNCNHGGGHCGGGGLAPDIWEFFKAHPYGVDAPWTSGLPSGFNSKCEIIK